ncbi:hypothetical protein [Nocardia sp. BMG111209]|uniref:hypothetical protein n=1 Tax=Nocardia sp. BMG111209 TaxID=1160137 RepID=UPI0003A3A94F|nr:hypothetical protein [Nocardia sp. BMG111209]
MSSDPVVTDPDLYTVLFENERVRVLEYKDRPGGRTHVHWHPDSVLIPLADFTRRISAGGREVEVLLQAGQVRWLDAQEHQGLNIGDTDSRAIFVELKEPAQDGRSVTGAVVGPSGRAG